MANPKYIPLTNYRNFCLWNHLVATFPATTNLCKMYFLGRMPYNEKKG
jgi:flagellar biosynthesis regulator FlbT